VSRRLSRKISPDNIEVVWAREILAGGTPVIPLAKSGDDAALQVSPFYNGATGLYTDNLRLRDVGFPQEYDGSNADVRYYLGHPTEAAKASLGILLNHAGRLDAKASSKRQYSVSFTRLQTTHGPGPYVTGITTADVQQMLTIINRVWSQVGVEFAHFNASQVAQEIIVPGDLFFAEADETDEGSTHDDITDQRVTPAIDIYFAHSLFDPNWGSVEDGWNAGETFFPGMGRGDAPALVIAAYLSRSADAKRRATSDIALTVAHELGHYLMKLGDVAHQVGNNPVAPARPIWDLMVSGDFASDMKRDLDMGVLQRIQLSGLVPGQEDA
jgi:hypothetical protein